MKKFLSLNLLAAIAVSIFLSACKKEEVVSPISFAVESFAYNSMTKDIEITSSDITITSGTTFIISQAIDSAVNTVKIKGGFSTYHIAVSKTGYKTFEADFSATQLAAFTESNPLEVELNLASLNDGLIAWYLFTGNAKDSSGNAIHGTIFNATLTTDKKGNTNSAYEFNGSSYINLPPDQLTLNVYTYSIWVNSTTNPTNGNTGVIFSIGNEASTKHQTINVSNAYGSAAATGWCVGGWNLGTIQNSGITSGTLPLENEWHHIVMVRTIDAVAMYLDNEFVGSSSTGGEVPLYENPRVANIGIRCNYTQGYTGKVDNFRIYNRALSAEEIGNIFINE
jgi:hypothetical protein